MRMIRPFLQAKWGGLAAMVLAVGLLATLGGAAGETSVSLAIGTGAGEPGGTAYVPVMLDTGGHGVATLTLNVRFDNGLLTLRDITPGQIVTDAGKEIAYDVPEPGRVSIIVWGLGDTVLGDGALMAMAFDISPGATSASTPLIAIDFSACTLSGEGLPMQVTDGKVTIVGFPAPADVDASDGTRTDGVLVRWSAVPGSGIQYRVYRARANDPEQAVALGADWQGAAELLDLTADPPVAGGLSCATPAECEPVVYYYWVKARNALGQTSPFGLSDTGYRGGCAVVPSLKWANEDVALGPLHDAGPLHAGVLASVRWGDVAAMISAALVLSGSHWRRRSRVGRGRPVR